MISPFFSAVLLTCLLGSSAFAFKVGVTAGPHAMIIQQVKEKAAKKGLNLDIQIVEFNDFILPNEALNEGELDANSYQHQPFLDEQSKLKGYQLTSVAKTVLMPMGLYSDKLKGLSEMKEGAKIAIPNDPTNGGRALKLLEANGFLKLKPDVALPSLLDITDNPKKLKIIELEAPQLPRCLPDVDAAVINTDWILLAGMDPKTALAVESEDSPYTNIIVVQTAKKDDKDVKEFVDLYQSKEIKDYIDKEFKGAVLVAW
ncbi:MetQ/NlpA family ABC transporter substrate-binding protein [Candidatus Paracaedibacter symbiosus]|uniref:MetQ/NlpA family ABC transporter substrate-binding protein n=1 Tax=Candidatus Paracaedibacter symbiosus TaxID=244582 RepID=UPI000509B61B|nr:MetQ/NlpA family ABC transporter substrate-binding protein [Candidatus Paracaedibacter symbiosus]